MTTSAVTLAVISSAITKSASATGDPVFFNNTESFSGTTFSGTYGSAGIPASNFVVVGSAPDTSGNTVTGVQNSQWSGNGTWTFPTVFPAGGQVWPVPTQPFLGGGTLGGGLNTPYQYIPLPPDLSQLEEGVHDIPGGKIIIKKIKVTEEQLDAAIQETLGHDATPEEKSQIMKEVEELAASEEREI